MVRYRVYFNNKFVDTVELPRRVSGDSFQMRQMDLIINLLYCNFFNYKGENGPEDNYHNLVFYKKQYIGRLEMDTYECVEKHTRLIEDIVFVS